MFKKILVSALAVGALALQAPAALAGHATYDCNFTSVAQETATGGQDTYTGYAYGYIVSPTPGETVSIRCAILVDGTEVASTPTGTGTNAAFTQGPITYTASDSQDVKLVAYWTAGNESGSQPYETTNSQIPPQEVLDALEAIFDIVAEGTIPVDLLLCSTLTTAGVPALVNSATSVTTISMRSDCDIYLGDQLILDFFPYES